MLQMHNSAQPRTTLSRKTAANSCHIEVLVTRRLRVARSPSLQSYTAYYDRWRPRRSLGLIMPCPGVEESPAKSARHFIAIPVLAGFSMCTKGLLSNTHVVLLLSVKRTSALEFKAQYGWNIIAQNTSIGTCRQRVGSSRTRATTWDACRLHCA